MRVVWPGPGRITLVLLVIVPAAMAYPWPTTTGRWALGVAAAVTVLALAWWRGMHLSTLVRRRLALLRHREPRTQGGDGTGTDARATAVLRVDTDGAELPEDTVVAYLDRYGIRCDTVRITSRVTPQRSTTWVSLTVSAAQNLAALRARSAAIPLRETTEIALRRLADELREQGWSVSTSDLDVPDLLGPQARQRWSTVADGTSGFVTAYRAAGAVRPAEVLTEASEEVWTATEFSGPTRAPRVAVACAVRSADAPGAAVPAPGLVVQRGRQAEALAVLDPRSSARLRT
ncbi:type VII secretion protein EccE [Mycolicibacterium palauense]|uniref:type VII secretion protein EccE n=1 Tax=Mycolicibacterium palauense TaxID=2034511 RepID=UPI000BFEE302|nr:type VII secretion protein EccE [Mycolicibacterium palauense]